MATIQQRQGHDPAVMELWRKAGVDFDRDGKSTLAELLRLGGLFPLSRVEDRLPLSHHCLYQWSRGLGDATLADCFVSIRGRSQGRALTILVDLVRLNGLIDAQSRNRESGSLPANPAAPAASFESLP